MPSRGPDVRPARALRLFAVFALVSLLPVLALGAVLAASYRADATERGLSESRAQAGVFARSAIEPLLAGSDLDAPLTQRQLGGLQYLAQRSVAAGDIVRFRLRDAEGRVVFSSDSGPAETDEAAQQAARGITSVELTHLDQGVGSAGRPDGAGIQVAEVYLPVTDPLPSGRHGVLEVYLPYDPIAHDIGAGLHRLYRDLALGLGLLYVVLAAISWTVTRRLRTQVTRNAYLAEHDQLTGLPNRNAFAAGLTQTLAALEDHDALVAVALIDLDRFQEINDSLGHSTGDALLVELAGHLAASAAGSRGDEVVARLGGDEFGVVITARDESSLGACVARLQQLVNRELDLSGVPVDVEASIGIAVSPQDGHDAGTLLQHADVAMYAAKQSSERIAFYDSRLDPYDAERLALVTDLRRALGGDELVLHYQPKLDLATGAVPAVEALLRWHHPVRGLLMPDTFLPVIEQTGMIDPLTDWVIDTALTWVRSPEPTAAGLRVAVNVSARNLAHPTFPDLVMSALWRHAVAPERLVIEVTETALVSDEQRMTTSLRRLAAARVRVSIDDFGRGQTSLSQLAVQPVHEVKIDKSFVMDMLGVPAHAAIVRSVIELAHNLGYQVVAEGVETGAVLEALRELGCDVAQGYHIARPMPADQLAVWLGAGTAPRCAEDPAASLVPR